MRGATAASECLIQQHEALNLGNVEHSPAAREGLRAELVDEEPQHAILDAVIVRLGNATHFQVGEPNEPLARNRRPELVIDEEDNVACIHIGE
jgi:hypothetical protein